MYYNNNNNTNDWPFNAFIYTFCLPNVWRVWSPRDDGSTLLNNGRRKSYRVKFSAIQTQKFTAENWKKKCDFSANFQRNSVLFCINVISISILIESEHCGSYNNCHAIYFKDIVEKDWTKNRTQEFNLRIKA